MIPSGKGPIMSGPLCEIINLANEKIDIPFLYEAGRGWVRRSAVNGGTPYPFWQRWCERS